MHKEIAYLIGVVFAALAACWYGIDEGSCRHRWAGSSAVSRYTIRRGCEVHNGAKWISDETFVEKYGER
jgi:hypothetical protein